MNFITINVRFECMVVKYKKKSIKKKKYIYVHVIIYMQVKRKDPFPLITPLYLTPLPSHLNKITFSVLIFFTVMWISCKLICLIFIMYQVVEDLFKYLPFLFSYPSHRFLLSVSEISSVQITTCSLQIHHVHYSP